jgi:hypothetical protein
MVLREWNFFRRLLWRMIPSPVDRSTHIAANNKKESLGLMTLGFRLLKDDCEFVLRAYRQLDQDHRDAVRLPLSPHSWPEFGEKWEYVDCALWMLSHRTKWIVAQAEQVWTEMGWTDRPLLFASSKDRSIVMANLLADLGKLQGDLERKIEEIREAV